MTQVVVTVEPETTIAELIELFGSRHISGVPVLSREGEVLGIVSTGDVLQAGESKTAIDVATRRVVAIDEHVPLSEAARVLLELGIRRLVVNRGGRLAGILTATDVLKWVARPALEALATLETADRPERATRLLGAAAALREGRTRLDPRRRAELDSLVVFLRAKLGAAFETGFAAGRSLGGDAAIDLALVD
jgi:CBS-domain-containing membrane protein